MRLRRSAPDGPGYRRRRRGSGFSYVDQHDRPLTDPAELDRCRALVIPPAWRDVWICPDPAGHIQAVGTDAAGRRQYLYHPHWRLRRDRRKFDRVLAVAARLPRLRRRVRADLADRELTRRRALALAARLIDLGLFRVGGDEYADGEDATYGVATLEAGHVTLNGDTAHFRYRAKGGIPREITITDPRVSATIRALRRYRQRNQRLLAYRSGSRWAEIRSGDVNEYLRAASGGEMTAKDLRTWHATVLAASALARLGLPSSPTGARRTVARVMREVSAELGNTPAVLRASYVDPRVVDLFHRGTTIEPSRSRRTGPAAESAVLDLLSGAATRMPGAAAASRSAGAAAASRSAGATGASRSAGATAAARRGRRTASGRSAPERSR
ncbi:DNA topoisomerase IB [Rugosimonospora acidiphila]|uniref:DNA topoisomerase n=1 Tax=Rugosimonospora acidiphila TaxID=556531 RepID=A0ABP9RYG6_9ACTN